MKTTTILLILVFLAALAAPVGSATPPKGAGTVVDEAAQTLFQRGGEELLGRVAKMHFRNAYKAMGLPMPEKKIRGGKAARNEEISRLSLEYIDKNILPLLARLRAKR